MNNLRLFIVLFATAALGLAGARAGDRETSVIKFSDPSKPGTLRIAVSNGDLHVRGADATEVRVTSDLQPAAAAQRKDGLRVLTSTTSYSLTEKDNVATLSYGTGIGNWGGGGGGDFEIDVPRNTNVILSSSFGGDTVIGGITGNIEVKNLNGEVKLEDVSGGALVETMNGEVEVTVRELHDGKPLSFTSMNGEVTVQLPADIKANVRLRTHNGAILTDFDEAALVTKTESLSTGRNGKHGVSVGGATSVEIQATVREAVRVGMEAARAARDAARDAAREAARNGGNSGDDDSDLTPEAPIPPTPPLPPMTGGKIVTGTLNGGGPEIRVTTMNGDVKLRKLEPAK